MKINLKSIVGSKSSSPQKTTVSEEEMKHNKNVDFYYKNIINAIMLYTYDSAKLQEMAPILINPLNELHEELEYAFTPACFETVFRVGLIDPSLQNELLAFKKKVDEIPKELWDYTFIDNDKIWATIRQKSDALLDKLAVTSRAYNADYTSIYDNKGNIIHKGKNCK